MGAVADFVGDAAEEQVHDGAVAVGGHGDQVAVELFGLLEDDDGRVTGQEECAGRDIGLLELGLAVDQILLHILGFAGDSVPGLAASDPQQDHLRAAEVGQFGDVLQDGLVNFSTVERHEDAAIELVSGHGLAPGTAARRRES